MIKNIGTVEGNLHEIDFIEKFNNNKKDYRNYFLKLGIIDYKNYWLVRVTTTQYSTLSKRKVSTRADAYLISCQEELSDVVNKNNGYLDEKILSSGKYDYKPVLYSGISIKLPSSNYQILKLTPNSFYALLGSFELGAGASLYCSKYEELYKNKNLIEGWKTTKAKMNNYFINLGLLKEEINFCENRNECEKIKIFSNKIISQMICDCEILKRKIFNGETLYMEPYTAWYITFGKELKELSFIPFNVTTGSGRSREDYTIVLKPSNR